jgi:vitamin B12 transporter
MYNNFRAFAVAAMAGLAVAPAGLTAETLEQPPIVVTATRTAQTADEALVPVIVIEREQIERTRAADVGELLRFHAGIDVARTGGPGQQTSVFLRGTNSNHTLVLVDGVRINPGTAGGASWQHLDPELIERIEIVKGPRSSLYGSEAIGGVVNLITRRARPGTHLQANAGYGRYDTREAGVGLHHRGGDLRIGFDANVTSTDGFPPRTTTAIERGHRSTGVNAYAGATLGTADMEASHWQSEGNTEYLTDVFDPATFTVQPVPVDQDFTNSVTSLRTRFSPTEGWASTLRLSHMVDEIEQNQSTDFARTRRNEIDWQNDFALGARQLLTLGATLAREDTAARVFDTESDERRDMWAVYLQDDIRLGVHQILLAARHTDHDAFGSRGTWNVEYGLQATPATRLTAGVGTAFRAPSTTERFGIGGNPDLQPERSRNLEVGVRQRLAARHVVGLSAFENRIEDLIQFAPLAPFGFQATNIGRARIRGLEASYAASVGPWILRAEAIAQDPVDLDTGEQLLRRARRSVTASSVYELGRWQLGADVLVSGRRPDIDADTFERINNPGYALVNFSAQLHLGPGLRLLGRMENLFDRGYEPVSGFAASGRALFVGLRWQSP